MLGFNSYNLLNTNNMFGMSNMYGMDTMFSMGNMFGNCGFGGSVFGMGYGSSPFMDCNGYTNYNAMAGYSIGNTLINFAGLALNSCLGSGSSQAQAASDLNTDLDSCLEDIEEILEELGLSGEADTVTASVIQENFKTEDLKEAEKQKSELEAQMRRDFANESSPTSSDANYSTWEDNRKALQADIDAAEKKVTEAREAQKELIEELKELIKERDEIKREINETILDNADGSKPKHRNTGLDLDKFNLPEGSTDKITDVTKQDIAQLIYLFRNAGTDNDRRTYQKAILNIADSAFLGVASNDQAKAREIIRNWSAQNSNV